jgi:putative DNA primase/helicase
VGGGFYLIGKPGTKLFIGEGYATGSTVHEATSEPFVVAFTSGNLLPVAKALKKKYPSVEMVIAADDDHDVDGNPGLTAAQEAAKSIGAKVAVPSFSNQRGTDWNDLAHVEGLDAVKQQLSGWRRLFKTRSQMEQGPVQFLIRNFIPKGVTFIGGLSGSGKTLFALSITKALTTGRPLLGLPLLEVPEIVSVIYCVPEMGERSFRTRMDRFDIPEEKCFCRTMQDGPPLALDHAELLAAVQELRPLVVLDTAIRFTTAANENQSYDLRALATGCFRLIQFGARSILALHHSPKSSGSAKSMTLENVLRGSGEFGAMSSTVYGLRCENLETMQVYVRNVKPRDFEPVQPFCIQGRPYIDETGDFAVLTEPGRPRGQAELEALVRAIDPIRRLRTRSWRS